MNKAKYYTLCCHPLIIENTSPEKKITEPMITIKFSKSYSCCGGGGGRRQTQFHEITNSGSSRLVVLRSIEVAVKHVHVRRPVYYVACHDSYDAMHGLPQLLFS